MNNACKINVSRNTIYRQIRSCVYHGLTEFIMIDYHFRYRAVRECWEHKGSGKGESKEKHLGGSKAASLWSAAGHMLASVWSVYHTNMYIAENSVNKSVSAVQGIYNSERKVDAKV